MKTELNLKVKKIKREERGITLIALVITIIVLLILAAISLTMLTGDNSILERAVDAKEMTDRSQAIEQARLDIVAKIAEKKGADLTADEIKAILGTYFDNVPENLTDLTKILKTKIGGYDVELSKVLDGITIGAVAPEGEGTQDPTELTISLEIKSTPQTIPTGGNVESVNSENIPIPTGFYPVAGTSKNSGFVISSVENDDLDNTKGGNQFVWVPVDQNQKLKLEVSAPENITEIKLIDPIGTQISVGTVSGKTFTNANINPTYNGEYKVEITAGETKTKTLVVRSLYAQDAFNDYFTDEWCASEDCLNMWIARKNATSKDDLYSKLSVTDDESFIEYAKNNPVYSINGYSDPTENCATSVNTYGGFYIGRFEAGLTTERTKGNANTTVNDIITESGLPLSQKNKDPYTYVTKDQASGLADAMYIGKSHLITGAGWFRTLGWLVNTSNKTLKQINAYSTEWGNYYDNAFLRTTGIAQTGKFSQTNANNIYDLAGNVFEETSEIGPFSKPHVVIRGGYYGYRGSSLPASSCNVYSASSFGDNFRF